MRPQRAKLDTISRDNLRTVSRNNRRFRSTPTRNLHNSTRVLREATTTSSVIKPAEVIAQVVEPKPQVVEPRMAKATIPSVAPARTAPKQEVLNQDIVSMPAHNERHWRDRFILWLPGHLEYAGLYYIATIILIAGMWISIAGYMSELSLMQTVLAAPEGVTLQYDEDADGHVIVRNEGSTLVGSERQPTRREIAEYTVGPYDSRVIRIPKINVEARIQEVAETDAGAVATPDNLFDVGWYVGSDKVGKEVGSAFMMGHRHGYTKKGIFYYLSDLKKGDLIEVEQGNGTINAFRVIEKLTYDVSSVDMNKALSPVTKNTFGLNLMTCVGTYLTDGSTYSERLLIRAEQVL